MTANKNSKRHHKPKLKQNHNPKKEALSKPVTINCLVILLKSKRVEKQKTKPQNSPKTNTEKAKPKLHKPKPSDAKN